MDMAPFYLMASPTSTASPFIGEHESFACRAGLADLLGVPPFPCPSIRMGVVTSILSICRGNPRSP